MWKLLIADDEPKIRRGLAKIIPWQEWGIELVGEAEDGQRALEQVEGLQPDILFMDINMPFINGLDLIEQMRPFLQRCIVIVITGYDEFAYAQKALKLRVFDYILKPVIKSKLESVIARAVESLEQSRLKEEEQRWLGDQIQSNSSLIRDRFLMNWLEGLTQQEEEIRRNLNFFELHLEGACGMLIVKVMSHLDTGYTHREWDKDLLEFASRNVVEDAVRSEQAIVFGDQRGHIVVLYASPVHLRRIELGEKVQQKLENILEKVVLYEQNFVSNGVEEIPAKYMEMITELKKKGSLSPVVVLAKKFIDRNYHQPELSLGDVAEGVQVSPTYLSKQLKRELGLSFIDYLTEVRIRRAIQMMTDPAAKVYEIAEMVGYSSQHYFSNTFKKVTGISPLMYRKGQR